MKPQILVYTGASLAGFWSAFAQGRTSGVAGICIGVLIGILVAAAYFYISLILGRWMLVRIEDEKSLFSFYRLILAICFGLSFIIWLFTAPWTGEVLTKAVMRWVGV